MTECSVAEQMFTTGLCLPSGSSMTDADQSRVIDRIRTMQHAASSVR